LSGFHGLAFSIEPGTAAWWLTRPVWLSVLTMVTLGLVALFARFEWRISDRPAPATPAVVLGALLTAYAAAMVAVEGLSTTTAEIRWIIPALAILGAMAVGALPNQGRTMSR
jgi:hypothetical protein